MNRQLRLILCIVMVMSVVLMAVCALHFIGLRKQLADTEHMLSESRSKWESIDSDKLVVQDELKLVRNDVKEANQSVAEWAEKSVSMQAEIDELKNWIKSAESSSK